MSHLVSLAAPITGAHTVKQYVGFGILGADIPTTGSDGGSVVLNDSIDPTKEYHWRVTSSPSAGTLTIYPDMSSLFSGAPDGTYSWTYRLFENGVDQGTATVSETVGTASVAGSAEGGLGLSVGSGIGGAATGGAAGGGGNASAPGGTGTSTGSGTGGSASGLGGVGTFTSDAMENNTGAGLLASVTVNWTWYKGAIGTAPTSTTHGTGTTSAGGILSLTGLPVGAGFLLARTADATGVYYQPGTVA